MFLAAFVKKVDWRILSALPLAGSAFPSLSLCTVLGGGSEPSCSEICRGGGRLSSTRRRRKGSATQSSHAVEDRRSFSNCLGTSGGSGMDADGGIGSELRDIEEGGEKDVLKPPFGDGCRAGAGNAPSAGDAGGDKELVDNDDERPTMLLVLVESARVLELSQSCNAHAPQRKKYCGSVAVLLPPCPDCPLGLGNNNERAVLGNPQHPTERTSKSKVVSAVSLHLKQFSIPDGKTPGKEFTSGGLLS